MKRRRFLKLLSGLPWLSLPSPPNIVLIMADDLGLNDLGCYGNILISTPHIDALALAGMRFTNAYAPCSKCSPTRWCVLTGKQMNEAHTLYNDAIILDEDRPLMSGWLRLNGYTTACIGKWGIANGDVFPAVDSSMPNGCGFDYFYGFRNHFEADQYLPATIWENWQEGQVTGYSMDLLLNRALEWLAGAAEPFFLYYASPAVHTNAQLVAAGYSGYSETPLNSLYAGWPEVEAGYASLVTRLDSDVGAIVAACPPNTIVIFCADNGPVDGGQRDIDYSCDFPYRGQKGSVYEGGIRVPLLVRWPGWIEPGSVSDYVCLISDIYATVKEIVSG